MVQGVVIEKGCILDVNPATGEVIEKVPVSTKKEVDKAVAAAHSAQQKWIAFSLEARTAHVKNAVKRIGLDKANLARMITKEMGYATNTNDPTQDICCLLLTSRVQSLQQDAQGVRGGGRRQRRQGQTNQTRNEHRKQ